MPTKPRTKSNIILQRQQKVFMQKLSLLISLLMYLLTDNEMEFNEQIKIREMRPEEQQIMQQFYEGDIFSYPFDTHGSKIQDQRITDFPQKQIEESGAYKIDSLQLSLEKMDSFPCFDHQSLLPNKIIDCQVQAIQPLVSKKDKDTVNGNMKNHNLAFRVNPIHKNKKKRKSTSKLGRFKHNSNPETKNIPKNYGKQIISFIKNEKKLTKKVLKKIGSNLTPESFNQILKQQKKNIKNIEDLRKLWIERPFCRQFRIMTQLFLRKYCLQWIFNSRLQNLKSPIKYRYRMLEGVKDPNQFFYLKDF